MVQHSGKFKLVVMKAESMVMCDPEWVVSEDLGTEDLDTIALKIMAKYHVALGDCKEWNAENKWIMMHKAS